MPEAWLILRPGAWRDPEMRLALYLMKTDWSYEDNTSPIVA
jgi:hypothetical protein